MTSVKSKLFSACLLAVMLAVPGRVLARPSPRAVTRSVVVKAMTYEQGLSYAYQWDSSVQSQTNSEGADGLGSALNQNEAHARVRLRAIKPQDDGSTLMEARLEEPHLIYRDEKGAPVEARDDDLQKQLQLPIYFEQLKDGSIGRVLAHPDDTPASLNVKRSIVSSFQTPAEGGDRFERDVSGSYKAHYEVADDGERRIVSRKRTQDDFETFADPMIKERSFALSDETQAAFDPKTGMLLSSQVNGHLLSSTNGRYGKEGHSLWSTAESKGSLAMLSVDKDGDDQPDLSAYGDVELTGAINPDETLPPGSEKQVLLQTRTDVELLQRSPSDPVVFNRLAEALRHSPEAVKDVGVRLGGLPSQARGSLINALAAAGTPAAQALVLQQLESGGEAADQALVALAFVARPIPEAVDAVEGLFSDSRSSRHEQATLVLGVLASELQRTQPFRAAVVAQRLEGRLRDARDPAEVALLLNGLGNAGTASSVEALVPYLSHDLAEVRLAAVDALRKHPASAVRGLLQTRITLDGDEAVREAARGTLRSLATPESGMQPATLYSWSWNRWLGGQDLGANFTALVSANTNNPNNITLSADGEAIGWAFQHSYSLVHANASSDVVTQSGVLKRHFNGNVKVLGNTLFNGDKYLTCGTTQSGSLYSVTQQFFSLSYTFYLAGVLPITLSLSASGSVSVPYEYRWDACNALVYMKASAKVTPTAWVSATGGVTVSIFLARGGASVTADLMKTGFPATAEAHINSGTAGACLNVQLSEQAISGHVDLWYQLHGVWSWGSRHSWTVWNFGSSPTSSTLYNYCWP